MIKIAHFADVHYAPATKDRALAAVDAVAAGPKPDVFLVPGDVFDHGIQNSEAGGLPELIEKLRQLSRIAPIVGVTGTPTHDVPGSYRALEEAGVITMIDPSTWNPPVAFLCDDGKISVEIQGEKNPVGEGHRAVLMIFGIPEPSLSWVLADKKGLGQEQANQALAEALRKYIVGLAAIRRQYDHLPCVVLYHGSLEGATYSETQRARGAAIGAADLMTIGADYYACGDIHLRQQVGPGPVWYSGSMFPHDWGELDQKAYNLVTIGDAPSDPDPTLRKGWHVDVESIPLPSPPRKKIKRDWPLEKMSLDDELEVIPLVAADEVEGYQVWMSYRMTEENSKDFDKQKALEDLLSDGALPGSRVTVDVISVETVRAEKITHVKDWRSKALVWAENSQLTLEEAVLQKIDEMAQRFTGVDSELQTRRLWLSKAKVRGLIGPHVGMGVDEIEIDFSKFGDGLMALLGRTGIGKTSLVESLHPWPEMFTRDDTLQSQYRLKDSYRDLLFVDLENGDRIRSLSLFDPTLAQPTAKYMLYVNDKAVTDGRQASYMKKLGEIFGTVEMYLRTAFIAQKPTDRHRDLAAATKGEKKDLFVELSDLTAFSLASEFAKGAADIIEPQISAELVRLERTDEIEELIGSSKIQRNNSELAVEQLQAKIEELDWQIKPATKEVTILEERLEEWKNKQDALKVLGQKSHEAQELALRTKKRIEELEARPELLSQAKDAIAEYDRVSKEREELVNERERIRKVNTSAEAEYRLRKSEVDTTRQGLERSKADGVAKIRELGILQTQKHKEHTALAEILDKPFEGNCPECGQPLPEDLLIPAKEKREVQQAQRQILLKDIAQLSRDTDMIQALIKEVDERLTELKDPEPPTLEGTHDEEIQKIERMLLAIDIDSARKIVEESGSEEGRRAELEKSYEQQTEACAAIAEEYATAAAELPPSPAGLLEQKKASRDALVDRRHDVEIEHVRVQEMNRAAQERLNDLEKELVSLAELAKGVGEKREQRDQWRMVQKILGPDCVQALELDALAPTISALANERLEKAYGSDFRLKIETTRIAGKGSATKQVEDFEIWVQQSSHPWQKLDTLSGGQSILVRKAIYDAFSAIRSRNAGTQWATVIMDEADSAIDSEGRYQYYRLLEETHNQAGVKHTIVITHSPEVQELIQQRINMEDFAS